MILKAIEESKLELSTPLSRFYPAVVNADKINIENLLRHRSGIYNFTESGIHMMAMQSAKGKDEIKKMISTLEALFDQDTQFSYCNTGYMLEDII